MMKLQKRLSRGFRQRRLRSQRLVEIGTYGSNPTEVAKYLILREIDDLTRAGVLKPQD
jgi:hypothetical protein